MGNVIAVILIALNLISWVYYSKYQFLERDEPHNTKANKAWHVWGLINRCTVIALFLLLSTIKAAIIAYLLYFILFDVLINKIALNKPISYIGNTSTIDKIANRIFKNGWYYLAAKLMLVLILLAIYFFK